MSAPAKTAVVLFSHGTVENLDDLHGFVTNIRRGRPPPKEVVDELRHRYQAIGGRSPLGDITRELARLVEARLGLPTRMAMRMWHPYPEEVLAQLAGEGIERVIVVPLAQHSTPAYAEAMDRAAAKVGKPLEVRCAKNWGASPDLTAAFAESIGEAWNALAEDVRAKATVVMTAHSVPMSVIQSGDPYEREVRKSAEAIGRALGVPYEVAFQSQGMGGGEWLGPDLPSTLDALASRGQKHALFAAIGFLSDHVEVLYDLDIEAAALGRARGLTTSRAASLNVAPRFVDAIVGVAKELLP
ncbi:ferrochelatase [Pendulispora brunnea]|uniref:Ferrochelatase n=1 Tax=Pendulispora brunnea TaxID=2905690 RepID=A0ABZ2KG91_9BACT